MTVKQLRIELEKYPDEMDVFMDERLTEFNYGLVNSVTCKEIDFYEQPDDSEPLASDKALILSES